MKVFIKVFLLYNLLANHLAFGASAAAAAVEIFYSSTFSSVQVRVCPFVANLVSYVATFGNPNLAQQQGFVDAQGAYLILGSTIVTDPLLIGLLQANAAPLIGPAGVQIAVNNLLAFIETNNGQQHIIFIDNLNRYAVVGGGVFPLFAMMQIMPPPPSITILPNVTTDPGAPNVTFQLASQFTQQSLANFLYSNRCSIGTFLQGSPLAPRTIYVFFEPNCPICNELYLQLKPFVDAGQLSIHWAPVYFISPTSFGKGAAILQGDVPGKPCSTPAQALDFNETNFVDESGSIPPATCVSFNAKATLNRDQQFFNVYTIAGTPFIIFKDVQGNAQFIGGLPGDIPAFVKNLFTGKPDTACLKRCK